MVDNMKNIKNKILVIVPRLPDSFEGRRDSRLYDMLRYLQRGYEVSVFYVQSSSNENIMRKTIMKLGINVFSLKELHVIESYDFEKQFVNSIKKENYEAIYFNALYTARYYLPLIETYLPEAKVILDCANLQFVSILEYLNNISDETKINIEKQSLGKCKINEIAVYLHADVIIIDNINALSELRNLIPGADIRVINKETISDEKSNALFAVEKRGKKKLSDIDVLIVKSRESMSKTKSYDNNFEILAQYPGINIIAREAKSLAESFNKARVCLRGDCTFVFTEDTVINKQMLENMYFCAFSDVNTGIVYPSSNLAVDSDINTVNMDEFILRHYRANFANWKYAKALRGECFIVKNQLVNSVGAMDENYKTIYFTLYDYCLKAQQAGYNIVEMNESFVYYLDQGKVDANDTKYDKNLFCERWANASTEFLHMVSDKLL